MKSAIAQQARALGFDACRFTTADPPASRERLARWLAEGRQGEMAYLARNAPKRNDPQLVLPGARSVVVLAASYYQGRARPPGAHRGRARPPGAHQGRARPPGAHQGRARPPGAHRGRARPPGAQVSGSGQIGAPSGRALPPPEGVVARYARFADYHQVLAAQLKSLAAYIDQLGGPGTRSLGYVDTGPILERDLAQRAGLGFVGKHTNLISRQLGNWFFIAEILTTLALEPDAPAANRCGVCTRCLSACPSGAITAPFQLDARRCVSYLTIELKGPIPLELRALVGNRIFGCDECLAACPWNKFAREGRLMKAHARPELGTVDLLELLSLDEPGFQRRFAGTPMRRVRRRGLLRNICVALGNIADQQALPALEHAAADPEPLIAEHARWAMTQIQARA